MSPLLTTSFRYFPAKQQTWGTFKRLVTSNALTTNTPLDPSGEHLLHLSQSIAEKTRSLTANLKTEGLQVPSFETTGTSDFPFSRMVKDALKLREQIIMQTKELHDLIVGPGEGAKALAKDVSSVHRPGDLGNADGASDVDFLARLYPSNL